MAVALSALLPSPCRPAKHPRHYTAAVPTSRARHTISQSAYMRAPRKARRWSLSHMPTARTGRHARPLKAAAPCLPTRARIAVVQGSGYECSPCLRARPPAAPSQLGRSRMRTHEGQRKGSARHSTRSAAAGLSERHLPASMGRATSTRLRPRAGRSHPARRERALTH